MVIGKLNGSGGNLGPGLFLVGITQYAKLDCLEGMNDFFGSGFSICVNNFGSLPPHSHISLSNTIASPLKKKKICQYLKLYI